MKVPERLMLASMWSVWGLISLFGFCWVLFAVLYFFDQLTNAADWVQAFGSIVAIIAAGSFPIWHVRLQRKEDDQRVNDCLCALADDQALKMLQLYECLKSAESDWGSSIDEYELTGRHLEWAPHTEALNGLDVTRLNLIELKGLCDLKASAQYAADMVSRLAQWSEESEYWKFRRESLKDFRLRALEIANKARSSRC